jgi:hypothetical protein
MRHRYRDDAKTSAVLGTFFTSDGVLSGPDYMRRLALQFADDRDQVLEQVRTASLVGRQTETPYR